MQQTRATVATPNMWNDRLKQTMVLVSGLCLFAVFYFSGTFKDIKFSSPPPSGNNKMAVGGQTYKTASTTTVGDVATKAAAFYATLSTSQQATLQQTYSTSLARKWSNLPCGAGCRNGIEFGDLNSTQLAAALAVIQAATGTIANDGYDEFVQIRLAEAVLKATAGGTAYDTTLRWIAFLNAPSATGAWMLQFGGHHYAANIAFNGGHVIGGTPYFMGLEPTSFTMNGTTYAPLNDEHDALTAMLASLTTSELASAKLTTTFSDCTMVPGETNGGTGTFPATKVGISCSGFTSTQKALVLAAISHYVQDLDATTAASIMNTYTNEIDGTYIAYTGTTGTSGDAGTFLNSNSNYVRIDGPTVWIELACQNGVVFPSQIHYHTVWRDHSHDYGVDLSGAPIDTTGITTSVAQVEINNSVNIHPNPATNQVTLAMATEVKDANVMLINATTGQRTNIATHYTGISYQYNVANLPAGVYIIKIETANAVISGRFQKL